MNNLNHLGAFKIIGDNQEHNFLFFAKYISVDFIFNDGSFATIEGGSVKSIYYTHNGNIILHTLSFSPVLYDCMISRNKIKIIKTHEWRIDAETHDAVECELTYHNFEFENYSANDDFDNGGYIYVLKGV